MPDGVLKTTITAVVGDHNFEFKIPNLHDEIKIGSRMIKIRRSLDPDWDGTTELEYNESVILRACAVFEVLLQRSSETWIFTPDTTGKPVVDSSKFPEDKAMEVMDAYRGYGEQLRTFREGGVADKPLPPKEAMASESNSG